MSSRGLQTGENSNKIEIFVGIIFKRYFPKFDPVYPEGVKEAFRKFPILMTLQRLCFFILVEAWSMVWLHKSFLSDIFQKVIESGNEN